MLSNINDEPFLRRLFTAESRLTIFGRKLYQRLLITPLPSVLFLKIAALRVFGELTGIYARKEGSPVNNSSVYGNSD